MAAASPARVVRSMVLVALATLVACGCASAPGATPAGVARSLTPMATAGGAAGGPAPGTTPAGAAGTTPGAPRTFRAEVWADNWFALYANGRLVGQDSVPITTERSFNAETITFSATYPLTIAMVTRDYMETDGGLEYIGTSRQQVGDGGFIAQVWDVAAGRVASATGPRWHGLVLQRAPLNPACAAASNPATACRSESVAEPAGWQAPGFDDAAWPTATVYTAAQVGTKEGYDTIRWDPSAALIWSADLRLDNVIAWRSTVAAPPS